MKTKYDYFWLWPLIYFPLGFFNILFAWFGMFDFMLPLLLAIFGGNKWFCNYLCGRGQLFTVLSKKFKCSRCVIAPKWLSSHCFRYSFLIFFMLMFMNVIHQTWLVYGGVSSLSQTVKLFWTFKIPWNWAYTIGTVPNWIAQFSFGFYSLMLTSELIGIILMFLYRPRTWCTFCPMGTMTQVICELKCKLKKNENNSFKSKIFSS